MFQARCSLVRERVFSTNGLDSVILIFFYSSAGPFVLSRDFSHF